MSDPSLCTTNPNITPTTIPPPFSSPAHQSRLAAKQRFCLEPPKPLTIDPLRFIGSRNQERTLICAMDDCSEVVQPIKSPTISTANVWPTGNEEELTFLDLPSKVLYDETQFPSTHSPHTSFRGTPDYENTVYESDSGEWLSGDIQQYKDIKEVPLATPEDVKDTDSSAILVEQPLHEYEKSKSTNDSSSLNYSPPGFYQLLSVTRKKKSSSIRFSDWNSDASISSPPPPIQRRSISSPLSQSAEHLTWAKIKQITVKEEFESTHISESPPLARSYDKQKKQLQIQLDQTNEREYLIDPKMLYKNFSIYSACENDISDTSSTSSADLASQSVIMPKQSNIQLINERYYNVNIVNIEDIRPNKNLEKLQKTVSSTRHYSNRDSRSLDRKESSSLRIVYQTQAGNPSYPSLYSAESENPVSFKKSSSHRTKVHPHTTQKGTTSPDPEGVYVFRVGGRPGTEKSNSTPGANQTPTKPGILKKHVSEKKFIMGGDTNERDRISV
ncbi:unnamed protein product [Heterobilharzia americana]|nr:unnamed protein product [Heterobilharzia americana]